MTINLITTQHSVHHTQVEWDVLSGIIAQFAYFESNKKELTEHLFLGRWDELAEELIRTRTYLQEFKDDYRQVFTQLISKLPEDNSLDRHINHMVKEGVLSFSELNKVTLLVESTLFIKQGLPAFKLPEFQAIASLDFQPVQRKFLREFRHLVDSSL